jgi:hypothetical protein
MARFFRNDEYCTSSHDVPIFKLAKEALRARDFPLEESQAVVRQFFDPKRFEHLQDSSRPIAYLVAPSTSGTNILPRIVAEELSAYYPGEIVQGWATPESRTRNALKSSIRKLREPAQFNVIPEVVDRLPANARLVLVDDEVTTGGSARALRHVLSLHNRSVDDVLSLGQSELRKVNARDIDRVVEKLQDPSLRPAVVGVLGGQLKHAANYIERVLNDNTRLEISAYFVAEYARLRELGLAYDESARGAAIGPRGLEASQRQDRAGAAISAGLPGESGSLRGSDDRSEGRTAQCSAIVAELTKLREQWSAAGYIERPGIVRKGLDIVDELGGPGRTGIPLRSAARDFLEGQGSVDLLTRRVAEHVAALSPGQILGSGRSDSIDR